MSRERQASAAFGQKHKIGLLEECQISVFSFPWENGKSLFGYLKWGTKSFKNFKMGGGYYVLQIGKM